VSQAVLEWTRLLLVYGLFYMTVSTECLIVL